jgi:hypothetical protein
MSNTNKVVNAKKPRPQYFQRDIRSLRCEQCRKVLLIDESAHCRLCAGIIAVYGKEAA